MRRFREYYIRNDSEEAAPPPSPPSKKKPRSRPSPKRKSGSDGEDTQAPPAKVLKTIEVTPTRKSERIVQKRKASDSSIEDESPLAKKSKKAVAKATSPHRYTGVAKEGSAMAAASASSASENGEDQTQSNRPTFSPTPTDFAFGPTTARFQSINKQMRTEKKMRKKRTPSPKLASKPTTKGKGKARADAADDGSDEDADSQAGKGTSKLSPSGKGWSKEKPDDAPNKDPWPCANRDCHSGQTYYDREGNNKAMGRKSISQFFGRNKKETNNVDANVWHNYCRKDYQRAKYNADKKGAKGVADWQVEQIEHQLLRMHVWRPDATFKVQLSKLMMKRSTSWHTAMRRNNNNVAQATAAYDQEYPKKLSKRKVKDAVTGEMEETPPTPEEAFPVSEVDDFDKNFCSGGQTYIGVHSVIARIKSMLHNREITSVPPIEILIEPEHFGETVNDPAKNYVKWCEHVVEAEDDGGLPLENVLFPENKKNKGRKLKGRGPAKAASKTTGFNAGSGVDAVTGFHTNMDEVVSENDDEAGSGDDEAEADVFTTRKSKGKKAVKAAHTITGSNAGSDNGNEADADDSDAGLNVPDALGLLIAKKAREGKEPIKAVYEATKANARSDDDEEAGADVSIIETAKGKITEKAKGKKPVKTAHAADTGYEAADSETEKVKSDGDRLFSSVDDVSESTIPTDHSDDKTEDENEPKTPSPPKIKLKLKAGLRGNSQAMSSASNAKSSAGGVGGNSHAMSSASNAKSSAGKRKRDDNDNGEGTAAPAGTSLRRSPRKHQRFSKK